MKNIYVFDSNLDRIGIVNKYSALLWVDVWSDIGNFQLWATLNDENSSILIDGNLVWIEEDSLGVIQKVEKTIDDEGERTLSVSGEFVESWIAKRIIWGKLVYTNHYVSDVMRDMLYTQVINPSDTKRKLPFLSLYESQQPLGEKIDITRSYSNVWDEIVSLAKAYDLNPRLRFKQSNKILEFLVESGSDKRDIVTISTDLGEILKSSYTKNVSQFKTTALIAGQGEETNRTIAYIGTEKEGLDRSELYVDARDLSKTNESGSELSEQSYINMLKQRGESKLSENPVYVDYLCSIDITKNKGNVYGIDYSLGDQISVYDSLLKLQLSAQVREYSRYWDKYGLSTDITVGVSIPTITQLIKKGGF